MAQHLNNNQLHQIGMPMLQGLNFAILNNQQHPLSQFAQPGQQGQMYQIVQQIPGQPGQVQLQNLQNVQQHQFNNHQFHQLQTPQQLSNQFNQQQQFVVQQQPIQQTQQIQQQNHVQQIQQMQQQPQQQQPNNQSNNKSNNNSNHNNSQVTKSGKKKKIVKVGKDGQPAPKRATTAYINFTQYYRESIKKTGGTVPKIGEFGKECAAKWKSMNEEEKRPFTEEAERDRERYRKEMEIFKPQRDSNKPKRPGTAFMLFMVDFRKEIAGREPEGGVAALAKLGGERWRGMTDKEKKPYVDQQNECKIVYEQKMEEYRKTTGQPSKQTNSSKTSSSVKSEVSDSDTSEQLNNSLSNSNLSNNKLNNDEQQHQQHLQNNNLTAIANNSPGSTSASPQQQANQTMSPQDPSQLTQIATTIPLQSQQYYTNFLDQPHEDASYSQTLDQQLHDGQQTQEQNDQQAYIQNGQQNYHHYGWN